MKDLFENNLHEKFVEYNTEYENGFTWWNYVNAEADIDMALAFAKFYCPDIMIKDGYFLLADKYDEEIFYGWKNECKNKKEVEQMMNLYSVKDFFHIKADEIKNYDEKVIALGNIMKFFWELGFKKRFPEKSIAVELFEEWDELMITVYEIL